MVREAVEGPDIALLAFNANSAMIFAIVVINFGFPALLTIALAVVGIIFALSMRFTFG
jgi:hypothetical protein